MIVKLVVNTLILGLLVIFFGLNLDTKIDIHFWFNDKLTIHDVSLFVALFVAYLVGVVSTIPIYVINKIKLKNKTKEVEVDQKD